MEGFEANSIMLRLRHLRENLEKLDRQFGRLAVNTQVARQVQRADLDTVQTTIRSFLVASTALWNDLRESIRKASPSGMSNELREHDPKHALRVQGSRPVAADSSTACTRPSLDSGEWQQSSHRECKPLMIRANPTPLGKRGEISLRPMTALRRLVLTRLYLLLLLGRNISVCGKINFSQRSKSKQDHHQNIQKIYRVWMK
ncbi:UNVERIFIED_CONTAM: hypothetical protein Sradi_7287400 [Sesamum radiatum]|uniref:Uncharacterized protein n=1 Tax=Sesamum radiatum TaxID=300843 RepID=A0AAW2II15_SESRA